MSQPPSPSRSSREHRPTDDTSPPVRESADAGGGRLYAPPSATRVRAEQNFLDALLESRLAVLCILFFVTGALGLPLLWVSRRFSWPERFLWAVAVTIYTIVLIALVAIVLRWSYNRIF